MAAAAAEARDWVGLEGMDLAREVTCRQRYAWDQTRSQGLVIDVEHDTLGSLTLAGPPLRFFGEGGVETTWRGHQAPPTLDQHGAAIREELASQERA